MNKKKKVQMNNEDEIIKIINDSGFTEITNELPVKFSEHLSELFDDIYPIRKRFKRTNETNGDITTILSIGREFDFIFCYGDSYYLNKWSRFQLRTNEKYFKEQLLSYLKVNERKIIFI